MCTTCSCGELHGVVPGCRLQRLRRGRCCSWVPHLPALAPCSPRCPRPLVPIARSLSFCRLAEEHATGGEPQRLVVPHPCTGTPRSFGRTIERAPVRQPMQRRSDEWFDAWWQEPCLQRAPPAAAAGPAAAGDDAAHRFLAECGESAGWAAIRPGNHRTFDVVVRYWRQGGRPCS